MSALLNVPDVLAATKGTLTQGGTRQIFLRVVIDSRQVRRGDLFVAIPGPRFDGHDFISQALQRGARGVIYSSRRSGQAAGNRAFVLVPDTVRALGQLAWHHRQRLAIPVIAITGSAGKTTTKELIAKVLATQYRVLASPGSHNNHIGVPLSVLKIRPGHQLAVMELGTNQPGDILTVARICCPTVAVYTNIGESHLARLRSPAEVFKEKSALVSVLPEQGPVVLNSDDPFLRRLTRRKKISPHTYGISKAANFQAQDTARFGRKGHWSFKLHGRIPFRLGTPVQENISNALAAICCGRLFHIRYNNMQRALQHFPQQEHRQRLLSCGGIRVLDDTYNANPVSVRSALSTLAGLTVLGRKYVVLGDMLELGAASRSLHQSLCRDILPLKIQGVVTFGSVSRALQDEIKRMAPDRALGHYRHQEDLVAFLTRTLTEGDLVLVKGSRGMKLEKVVAALKQHFS